MTPVFLAIDPGFSKSNGTGWALFSNRELLQAGLAASDEDDFLVRCREIVAQVPYPQVPRIIEHMRVYPGPQQKGDQNDLLNLSFLEGLLAARVSEVRLVPARSWKGNVPKNIMQDRISARFELGSPEGRVFEDALLKLGAAEKRGSLIEACGLGLWTCGRLG